MRYLVTLFFLLGILTSSWAQTEYTIKGKIIDADTKESLVGVSVGIKEMPAYGIFSDEFGYYDLALKKGSYTVVFRLLGYDTYEQKINLTGNERLDVNLEPDAFSLTEIEVTARRKDDNVTNVQMGVDRLEIETINKIPVIFGEKDILKTIQLLPGVQTAGEGNSGFYVRGGSSDQNLILLDDAIVYNPSHLLGFFSTFNSDAVSDMTIYKGAMPAQYGGRLSSALDVSAKDGDLEEYAVNGGVGLISSRLSVEGPIQKGQTSFLLAGRRTYADALGKAIGVKALKNSTLYFYDLNAKLNYVLSDKDKITFTGYYGKDKLGLSEMAIVDWGNGLGSLRWNHQFSTKAASVTTLALTDYTYNVHVDLVDAFQIASHITDYTFNQEFRLYPNEKNTIRLGLNSTYRRIVPGNFKADDPESIDFDPFAHRYAWENAVFANNSTRFSERLELGYGLRLSTFSTLGGGNFYTYDNQKNIIDTTVYDRGKFVKTYWSVEPRLSIAYQLDKVSSVKAAYARTTQNMHLLKISNLESTPTDRWVSSNNYIKPEISNQVSIGYFRNFADNMYEFSAEFYYKDLQNQIDYKDGTHDIITEENIEPYLLFGKGRAYGMELFLKKKFGRFNGWLGYTLSRSEKKIDGINDNKWYAANQHRAQDISIVGIYELTKKWTLSATWVYTSGTPITFPSGKFTVGGQTIPYYDGRNQSRTPAYHRLDLGATCILKNSKKFYSDLSFSIYNAYGRKNAYAYDFKQNQDDPSISETEMIYLFSILPSITWNFKF